MQKEILSAENKAFAELYRKRIDELESQAMAGTLIYLNY
jgi:hypothetical protein